MNIKKKSAAFVFVLLFLFIACKHNDNYTIEAINDFTFTLKDKNNALISDATIKLYNESTVVLAEGKTDALGQIKFLALPVGEYQAKVFIDNTEFETTKVKMSKNISDRVRNFIWVLNITIERFDFSLAIKNSDGTKAANRKVALYKDAESTVLASQSQSDTDGNLMFKGLSKGTYYVNIYNLAETFVIAQKEVQIEASQSNQLDVTLPRLITHNSDFVITGIFNDPKGYDSRPVGFVDGGVTYNGPFEYIQLLALKDIDFNTNKYCAVFCPSNAINANGWAQGGTNTYQINIDRGTVKAGDFFYVGGTAQLLYGYSGGQSPAFPSEKYIAKDYYSTAGDGGIGNALGTVGLLANSSATAGAGYAVGVAVFKGISITKTTIPMDVVFWGDALRSGYNYQITDNDLYSRNNLTDGSSQPLFGQGSNTGLIGNPRVDAGDFLKLGGKTTSTEWIEPRVATGFLMNNVNMRAVSDLEQGPGVTSFIKE